MALWRSASALAGCDYVVIPESKATAPPAQAEGVWTAVATSLEDTADGLAVELAIRNDTADWSAMELAEGRPVTLVDASGSSTRCDTAVVGTGGTSIPPGFIMRGYTGGTRFEPQVELLRVECAGSAQGAGSKLRVPYTFTTGEFNFYRPEAARSGTLVVDLDAPIADLAYPIGTEMDLPFVQVGEPIEAINDIVLTLVSVERSADEIQLNWRTENPTKYQAYVHIGNPPVIGSDGILYGLYRAPHLVDTPITLANEFGRMDDQRRGSSRRHGAVRTARRGVQAAEELRQPRHRDHRRVTEEDEAMIMPDPGVCNLSTAPQQSVQDAVRSTHRSDEPTAFQAAPWRRVHRHPRVRKLGLGRCAVRESGHG